MEPYILIVEDEDKLADLLTEYLEDAGYKIQRLRDGDTVLPHLCASPPQLMLLDLMLPGMDGLSVCREVRKTSDLPIVITTARIDEIDRLLGLELGADDYICKPYSPREVVARVKAVLRRMEIKPSPSGEVQYGGITVHPDSYRVEVGSETVDVTRVEFRLLSHLLGHVGQVFSRQQLMDVAYTDGRVVTDRTIDTHMKNLRKKLNAFMDSELIHSVYGVGYRLEKS